MTPRRDDFRNCWHEFDASVWQQTKTQIGDIDMKATKRRALRMLLGAGAMFALAPVAHAQASAISSWPTKPIRLIVPFPPGGSTDMIARYLAQGLSESLGQTVIVDNRSGASGNIGTDAVVKSSPDGYTIGLVTSGPLVNNRFLFKKMPFDADKDLAPIGMVCEIPLVFASNATRLPAHDLREFIALARAKPGDFSVGTPGNGTIGHLALVSLNLATGLEIQNVPYRGDAPAMTDVLGGAVQVVSSPISAYIPNLRAGRLRGLAVTSAARFPGLPDIPTAKEQGVDIDVTVWLALVGPAALPRAVVQKLNASMNLLLNSSSGRSKLLEYGAITVTGTPELLSQRSGAEAKRWQRVIASAHIELE